MRRVSPVSAPFRLLKVETQVLEGKADTGGAATGTRPGSTAVTPRGRLPTRISGWLWSKRSVTDITWYESRPVRVGIGVSSLVFLGTGVLETKGETETTGVPPRPTLRKGLGGGWGTLYSRRGVTPDHRNTSRVDDSLRWNTGGAPCRRTRLVTLDRCLSSPSVG